MSLINEKRNKKSSGGMGTLADKFKDAGVKTPEEEKIAEYNKRAKEKDLIFIKWPIWFAIQDQEKELGKVRGFDDPYAYSMSGKMGSSRYVNKKGQQGGVFTSKKLLKSQKVVLPKHMIIQRNNKGYDEIVNLMETSTKARNLIDLIGNDGLLVEDIEITNVMTVVEGMSYKKIKRLINLIVEGVVNDSSEVTCQCEDLEYDKEKHYKLQEKQESIEEVLNEFLQILE